MASIMENLERIGPSRFCGRLWSLWTGAIMLKGVKAQRAPARAKAFRYRAAVPFLLSGFLRRAARACFHAANGGGAQAFGIAGIDRGGLWLVNRAFLRHGGRGQQQRGE